MLWKNKKSGELYVILDTCLVKHNAQWKDGIIYRKVKDPFLAHKFVQDLETFKEKFDEVKDEA